MQNQIFENVERVLRHNFNDSGDPSCYHLRRHRCYISDNAGKSLLTL